METRIEDIFNRHWMPHLVKPTGFETTDSVIVSIGRGRVQDTNYLPDETWASFKADVFMLAEDLGEITFQTEGFSTSEGWGREESFTVGVRPTGELTRRELRRLVQDLVQILAYDYNQDAIAVTWGETELVTPTEGL